MPLSLLSYKLQRSLLLPVLGAVLAIVGCPQSSSAPVPSEQAAAPLAADRVPADAAQEPAGPPPERYATLPPGAFEDSAAAAGNSPAAPPPDVGLLPNAGTFNLTGVRVGMTMAEVEGRYTADSGWDYDKRLVEGKETGVLMAKPRDYRARASELFYLLDGRVVAFLRVVQEDSDAFGRTTGELREQYGKGSETPPQWARSSHLLRSWRSTANELAEFWGDARRRQVLTAGHSPTGGETIYMLFSADEVELVQQAMSAGGQPEPEPEPDRSWNLPPASGN